MNTYFMIGALVAGVYCGDKLESESPMKVACLAFLIFFCWPVAVGIYIARNIK